MAGAVLHTIQRKLSFLIPKASSSSSSVKPPIKDADQQLRKLEKTMKRIHAELDDAEERDVIDKSEHLRLCELREVAYDAEDVMDDYEYEVLRAKVEARRRARESHVDTDTNNDVEVLDCNSYQPEISISDDLISRVREIRQRFEELTDDWSRISMREKDEKRRRIKKWKPVETTSFPDVAVTFGRKDEKDKIMDWLLQGADEHDEDAVSVLTIIGMGGIGKTTLAQLIYNDLRVSKYFDFSAWLCVSEDFDVVGLTKKIITSLYMGKDDMSSSHELHFLHGMSLDDLFRTLKKKLEGKKLFLVLDDVWNQKAKLWDSLKRPLIGVGIGKILVTTRNEHVARLMQTTLPIYLSKLSFDDSWSLFENIALRGRHHNLHYSLFDIGKKIVKKCQGLPLAVKVVASILRLEDDEEEWIDVLKSELWELQSENNDILPALKLSYDRMPIELRPCFMYLSLFPKDSILFKVDIVHQWMSHGFLHANEKEAEEDIGNAYFHELLQRSILQYHSTLSENCVTMHDLTHDLAQFVARDEYLLITVDKMYQVPKFFPKTIRHLSAYIKDELHFRTLLEFKGLRTLVLHNSEEFPIAGSLENLTCLRTLVLMNKQNFNEKPTVLPDAFDHLKHLRYLSVGSGDSTNKSTYKLYHLQTLCSTGYHGNILTGNTRYSGLKLSRGIGDLINLRHLHAFDTSTLDHGIAGLTNLRTLERFSIGDESWQCKVRHLKGLINLRGSLAVYELSSVKWSDVTPSESYLKTKRGIEALELHWGIEWMRGRHKEGDNEKLAEQVLECLQPHHNLREFTVGNYPSATFPAWLGDASFCRLEVVSLQSCNCNFLPSLGKLPGLKVFKVFNLERLTTIGREFSSPLNPSAVAIDDIKSSCFYFPSLEKFELQSMNELEEWNGVEASDFPRLRLLVFWYCPKLKRLPSFSALTELSLQGRCNPELLFGSYLPMLQSLQLTTIEWEDLKRLDASSVPCLSQLVISSCPKLKRIPSLPALTQLYLKNDWNPELLSCCCLPKLRCLTIQKHEAGTLIFPSNQSLCSLEELVLVSSNKLRSVAGFGNLASLQHLKIEDCPILGISPTEHLPPYLLPQNMIIEKSPEAEKWYRDQVLGDFWKEHTGTMMAPAAN